MSERIFEAPGPGTWELDATHLSKPVSLYTASIFPDSLARGFKIGTERFGLFFSHLQPVFIHGFCYTKPMLAFVPEDAPPGPPPEGFFEQPGLVERFANGKKAIENKLWREDLRRWDEEVKPDSIRRNQKLQSVSPESLNTGELIQHLIDCYQNLIEMWYRHHIFTIPSLIPTGLYLGKACEWTGVSPGEALELLKGSSPVSAGIAAKELGEVATQLKQAGVTPDQFDGQSADEALQAIRTMPEPVGPTLEKYLDIVSYQLTSGYDITERYALEMPEVLVGNLWSAMANVDVVKDQSKDETLLLTIRNKVPSEHQAEFDSLLKEARHINRLRDERGVYNEAKAFGLSRRAVLEAGKRLEASGHLHQTSALLQASHEEMLAMLGGESGPGESELRERINWYESKSTDDAPPFLGPPPEPPPPLEVLPEDVRVGQGAFGIVIVNVFDHPTAETGPEGVVKGSAVSAGIYEGTARLIKTPADFHRLQQGDVLVTKNTSATFNLVLPMLGAIVTDRGGQLSHAAIVAREYGIPGIVSTRNATQVIPDGAKVRVDGSSGTVEIL